MLYFQHKKLTSNLRNRYIYHDSNIIQCMYALKQHMVPHQTQSHVSIKNQVKITQFSILVMYFNIYLFSDFNFNCVCIFHIYST